MERIVSFLMRLHYYGLVMVVINGQNSAGVQFDNCNRSYVTSFMRQIQYFMHVMAVPVGDSAKTLRTNTVIITVKSIVQKRT